MPADRPVGRMQNSDRAISWVSEINIARAIDSNATRARDGCIDCGSAIARIALGAVPRDSGYDSIGRNFADSVVCVF